LLTDKNGIPLAVIIAAVNIHNMKAAIRTTTIVNPNHWVDYIG